MDNNCQPNGQQLSAKRTTIGKVKSRPQIVHCRVRPSWPSASRVSIQCPLDKRGRITCWLAGYGCPLTLPSRTLQVAVAWMSRNESQNRTSAPGDMRVHISRDVPDLSDAVAACMVCSTACASIGWCFVHLRILRAGGCLPSLMKEPHAGQKIFLPFRVIFKISL